VLEIARAIKKKRREERDKGVEGEEERH